MVDTATNTGVGDPIPIGDAPIGIAISADGTRGYVALTNVNEVVVVALSET